MTQKGVRFCDASSKRKLCLFWQRYEMRLREEMLDGTCGAECDNITTVGGHEVQMNCILYL